MAGLAGHWWVLLILAVIALIILGPSRLPEVGSGMGKAIREFRKATSEATEGLREELRKADTATGTTYTATPTPVAPEAPASPAAPQASAPAPPPEAPKV